MARPRQPVETEPEIVKSGLAQFRSESLPLPRPEERYGDDWDQEALAHLQRQEDQLLAERRRRSREQQQRAAAGSMHASPYQAIYERQSVLSGPPARPGYVQYWMNVEGPDGKPNHINMVKMANAGWRPRKVETETGGFQEYQCFRHDRYGDVYGYWGNILVERPKALAEQERAYHKSKADRQLAAVRSNMFKMYTPGQKMGRLEAEHNISVTKGREPSMIDS